MQPQYQADVFAEAKTIAPGASLDHDHPRLRRRQGIEVLDHYQNDLGVKKFDMLIDWGWFHFITRPMFWLLETIYKLVGNFGVAILVITLLVKALFFPLANKSYLSMAKMKTVQPKMKAIQEQYADDKAKQQQEIMELYKREKINPVSGCLPMVLQIPVFFSLYKVLFVSIEMRQAPFFGWIKDLASPDPTNVFTLFGLSALRSDAGADVRAPAASRHLAARHGRVHVGADEDEPRAGRPRAKDHVRLDAGDLHLHARLLPGGPGHLLDVEQLPVGGAADADHEEGRREGRIVRQSEQDVCAQGGVSRVRRGLRH